MDKFFLASRTIQGIIVAAVPTVFQLCGWAWSEDWTAQLNEMVSGVVTAIGLVWAFAGRWRARGGLRATPPVPGADGAAGGGLGCPAWAGLLALVLLFAACAPASERIDRATGTSKPERCASYQALLLAVRILAEPDVRSGEKLQALVDLACTPTA